jgi:hypothetical protein
MLNHDIPVPVVSRLLVHGAPSVTLDVYAHNYVKMHGDAPWLMDEIVTPIPVEILELANGDPDGAGGDP